MSEYFSKIIAKTAAETATFEESKQELRKQISVSVVNASQATGALHFRKRETLKGLAEA